MKIQRIRIERQEHPALINCENVTVSVICLNGSLHIKDMTVNPTPNILSHVDALADAIVDELQLHFSDQVEL